MNQADRMTIMDVLAKLLVFKCILVIAVLQSNVILKGMQDDIDLSSVKKKKKRERGNIDMNKPLCYSTAAIWRFCWLEVMAICLMSYIMFHFDAPATLESSWDTMVLLAFSTGPSDLFSRIFLNIFF